MNVITIKQDLLLQLKGRISNWKKNKERAHILKLKTQLLQKIKQKKPLLTNNIGSTGIPLIHVEFLQEASDSIGSSKTL